MANLNIRVFLSLALLLVGPALAHAAQAEDHTAGELAVLRAQNAELRDRVAQSQQQQNETWMHQRRQEEVQLLISQALADAQHRSTMLHDAATAGHDGRFFLASADNRFRLNVGGHFQFRYIANFRDDAPTEGDTTAGFQARRTYLLFNGHIGDPRFVYSFLVASSRNGGNTSMEAVSVSYALSDQLTLSGGVFQAPFLREWLVSSRRLLTVDRSLVHDHFTTGYSSGVQLSYAGDDVRLAAMLNQGANRNFTNFNTPGNADFALTARADVKLTGQWSQYTDFAAWAEQPTAAFLGAAAHYEIGEGGTDAINRDFFTWTVDATAKHQNLGLFAAVVGRHDLKVGQNEDKFDDFGIVAQLGYMIEIRIEPFVRYEILLPDNSRNVDNINVLTAGMNYYLVGHSAKFTADVVYVFDPLDPAFRGGSNGLGLLNDAPGQDGQTAVRAQFQLIF